MSKFILSVLFLGVVSSSSVAWGEQRHGKSAVNGRGVETALQKKERTLKMAMVALKEGIVQMRDHFDKELEKYEGKQLPLKVRAYLDNLNKFHEALDVLSKSEDGKPNFFNGWVSDGNIDTRMAALTNAIALVNLIRLRTRVELQHLKGAHDREVALFYVLLRDNGLLETRYKDRLNALSFIWTVMLIRGFHVDRHFIVDRSKVDKSVLELWDRLAFLSEEEKKKGLKDPSISVKGGRLSKFAKDAWWLGSQIDDIVDTLTKNKPVRLKPFNSVAFEKAKASSKKRFSKEELKKVEPPKRGNRAI